MHIVIWLFPSADKWIEIEILPHIDVLILVKIARVTSNREKNEKPLKRSIKQFHPEVNYGYIAVLGLTLSLLAVADMKICRKKSEV